MAQLALLVRLPRRFLVRFVFNTKWDACLTIIPGILLLATGLRQIKEAHMWNYLYVLTYDGYHWLQLIPALAVIAGITAVFLGVFRFAVITFDNKNGLLTYVGVHGMLICAYVVTAASSAIAHGKIIDGLGSTMKQQLALLYSPGSQFSTTLQENWDQLQMQLRCCGVQGYQDYTAISQAQKAQTYVPMSCCVLKPGQSPAQAENVAQCQTDARVEVRDSLFINTKGCLEPLSNWFSRFVYVPQRVFWSAAFAQSLAILQGLWMYRTSTKRLKKTAIL